MKKVYNIYQKNPKKKYEGAHYAIQGCGGFVIKDSYAMKLEPIRQIGKYDMTNAVHILFSASKINAMLGGFNCVSETFFNDCITINCEEFLNMKETDIISVGSLDSMYFDYKKYIQSYLGSVHSLFMNEINSIFDTESLYAILQEKIICPYSGEIKNGCNGYIEIKNINATLKRICELDIFGNRFTGNISQGFLSGDLLYIKDGMMIKLDIGMKTDNSIKTLLENSIHSSSGIESIPLSKKYTVPLLIRLI
jgi:hypothetical protein